MTRTDTLKNNDMSLFFETFKDKVANYFALNNKHPKSHPASLAVQVTLIVALVAIFGITLLSSVHWVIKLFVLPFTLSAVFCLIGFTIMHSAAHSSLTKNSKLNAFITHVCNVILGVSMYFWKKKHNIDHHTYTNIPEQDLDFKIKYMRFYDEQPWKKYHKYQHIYGPFGLYSFLYFVWMFINDFQKYFSPQSEKMKTLDHFIFWFAKTLHIGTLIALSIIYGPIVLLCYFIFGYATGSIISNIFQPAHLVMETTIHPEGKVTSGDNEWALAQIASTTDFAPKSWFWRITLGGLNFQVIHHLCTKINPGHYPAIQQILVEHCTEFGVNYHCHPTYWSAISSHFDLLIENGKKPEMRVV